MNYINKSTLTLTILAILLSGTGIYSQVTQEWVARYNGINNDEGFAVFADGLGNVYVAGHSLVSGSNYNYVTIKYNSSGMQNWLATYNGPANHIDDASFITVDNSGNVYVTGRSVGIGSRYDYLTIKYNSAGIQQWVQRYNGSGNENDHTAGIAVDGSGNVYVTGSSAEGRPFSDCTTVKYDSFGSLKWVQIYRGPEVNVNYASSIAVDNAGNSYVVGRSVGIDNTYDYAVIKYDTYGTEQWVQRYNGPDNGDDNAYSICLDQNGNVYITGESQGKGIDFDYATIKYNSNGVQQWAQRFSGSGISRDVAGNVKSDNMGNVYVTGLTQINDTLYSYTTIKYNASGAQQWVQSYTRNGNGFIYHAGLLALDGLGNVYVTGESAESVNGLDYLTIKYNAAGSQQWIQRYNGTGNGNDYAYSMAVDNSGNVYVAGASVGNGTSLDIATVKYTQPIGITPIFSEVPLNFSLSQNYPNPFNPTTTFEFKIAKSGFVSLTIYDAMGREIETLVNGEMKPGTYKADWDGGNFSSGIYYYTLQSEGFTETRKMVLMK